ncbi:MAG: hypothetical protein R3E42_04205 [Burkholderiaceae bacterium]
MITRLLGSRSLTPAAFQRLLAHPWPGNLRELRNALDYAASICIEGPIGLEDLPELQAAPAPPRIASVPSQDTPAPDPQSPAAGAARRAMECERGGTANGCGPHDPLPPHETRGHRGAEPDGVAQTHVRTSTRRSLRVRLSCGGGMDAPRMGLSHTGTAGGGVGGRRVSPGSAWRNRSASLVWAKTALVPRKVEGDTSPCGHGSLANKRLERTRHPVDPAD